MFDVETVERRGAVIRTLFRRIKHDWWQMPLSGLAVAVIKQLSYEFYSVVYSSMAFSAFFSQIIGDFIRSTGATGPCSEFAPTSTEKDDSFISSLPLCNPVPPQTLVRL